MEVASNNAAEHIWITDHINVSSAQQQRVNCHHLSLFVTFLSLFPHVFGELAILTELDFYVTELCLCFLPYNNKMRTFFEIQSLPCILNSSSTFRMIPWGGCPFLHSPDLPLRMACLLGNDWAIIQFLPITRWQMELCHGSINMTCAD